MLAYWRKALLLELPTSLERSKRSEVAGSDWAHGQQQEPLPMLAL